MERPNDKPAPELRCRLLDGSVHLYRAAATLEFLNENPGYSPFSGAKYLGQGVTYAHNNYLQHGTRVLHFWADDRPSSTN